MFIEKNTKTLQSGYHFNTLSTKKIFTQKTDIYFKYQHRRKRI